MSRTISDPGAADLTDPFLWRKAEAHAAGALARAASALGALDALAEDAPWLPIRLALIEAESMLGAQDIELRREDIGRDLMAAWSGADAAGLTEARWSIRRLVPAEGGPLPPRRPVLSDLRLFLGLHRSAGAVVADAPFSRPCGEDFDAAALGFTQSIERLNQCHPLTQAAAALPLWRLAGLSAVENVIEPATYAAILASDGLTGIGFAPMARQGREIWRRGGSITARLTGFYDAIRFGAIEARDELRRLRHWRADSLRKVAVLKGGTPARLVEIALTRPLIGTEDAERALGMSRDSAERGLARLEAMGLLREITGRGRYRLWAVAV